jgi:hypothetical protein
VRATAFSLLVVALVAGCGGGDEGEEPARPPVTETSVAPPEPPPPQPTVERAERAAASALVSRYADALSRGDVARACSLVWAPALRNAPEGCEAKLERFVRGSELLRKARTVPLWDTGSVDRGTGALRGRVKVGFPAEPRVRWVFTTVKRSGRPWRIGSVFPSEIQRGGY